MMKKPDIRKALKLLPFDYAARNLGRSRTRSMLGFAGSVLVVLLVIAAGSFVRGMGASLRITGGEHNVMLLGSGSEESVERSEIPLRAAGIAAASIDGIRERLGERYVSPEVHSALSVAIGPEDTEGRLTVVRGVRPTAFLVHPQVQVIEGRAPEPGRDEVMIGNLVASKLGVDELGVGQVIRIDDTPWTISGKFRAPRTVMDAEIWMPLSDLQVLTQRDDLSCVVLTLDPTRGSLDDVATFAVQRLDLELVAMAETEYYAALGRFFAPIRFMVLVTAGLIALGGILGGLNTMYAAFSTRAREIGTLQVFGYGRIAVMISILQESLLTTSAGAILGAALGAWWLDGIAVRFSMGAFGLIVDAPVIALGIGAGLLLGCVGALPPAIRCIRLSIHEALKA